MAEASLTGSAAGQCLNGVQDTIVALAMTGFPTARVVIRQNAYLLEDDPTPLCVVSLFGSRPAPSEGTNRENTIHFEIIVTLHWAGDRGKLGNMGVVLVAMETIIQNFAKRAAASLTVDAGGACLKSVNVRTAEALNRDAWAQGFQAFHCIVDCEVRLPYPA